MAGWRAVASRVLFALARGRAAGAGVRWGFAHISGRLPVSRVYESKAVVAFHHPRPSYAVHVLIVPKRGITGVRAIGVGDGPLLVEVVAAARAVARRLDLERHGYRLVVNGGAYQDVCQLHFHLISDGAAEHDGPV